MRRATALAALLLIVGALGGQTPTAPGKPQLVIDADGHNDVVRRVLFTPNGKQVITVSVDKSARVWDLDSGDRARIFRLPSGPGDEGSLSAAAISPDGKFLAVSGMPPGRGKNGILVYLVSLSTGQIARTFRGHENIVTSLAFSRDGARLASSSVDKTVLLTDVRTSRVIHAFKGHTDAVRQVIFSPDGTKMATAGADNTARIWSMKTGKSEATLAAKARALSVAWSPDGKTIATGHADGTIGLWEPTGKSRKVIGNLKAQVLTVAFTPDSKELLFTGSALTPDRKDLAASILDITTGAVRTRCDKHTNTVMHGAVSPDGKLAVTTGGNNNETYVWNTADGTVVHTLASKSQTPWDVAWSPDGKSIAWGSNAESKMLDRSFVLDELEFGEKPTPAFKAAETKQGKWSLDRNNLGGLTVREGTKIIHPNLDLESKNERVYSYTWLKDGRAAIGGAGALYLVDPKANRVVRRFVGHTSHILGVAPSPDGKLFVSGALDQTIRIWDPEREEPVLSLFFAEEEWIAWTGEGYYAASVNGERLIGWLVNRGPAIMPNYWPAARFHAAFYQPDVIKKVPATGSVNKVLLAMGKKPGDLTSVTQALPPTVTITSPTVPSEGGAIQLPAEGAKLTIEATAKSSNSQLISGMRLLVNGRPYKGQAGLERISPARTGPVNVSWNVELPPGRHTIGVQAVTQQSRGMSSFMEVACGDKEPPPANLYVLAIGISDYAGSLKLNYAAADANVISATLKSTSSKLFGKVETKVITNKNATRKEIVAGLNWLSTVMTPRDVAVVSFSGHGANERNTQYLIPVDCNVNSLATSCIPGELFKNALGDLPGKVICILDACHSGGVAENNKRRNLLSDLVRDLITDDYGVIVLCSSLGSEVSLEGSNVKQGFFTAALVEGLKGKADFNGDGVVHLNELEGYAARRVKEMTRGMQNPIFAKPPNVEWFPLATTK